MYMFRIISRLLGKIDVINKDIIKFHITNFIIVIYVMFIKYHRLKEVWIDNHRLKIRTLYLLIVLQVRIFQITCFEGIWKFITIIDIRMEKWYDLKIVYSQISKTKRRSNDFNRHENVMPNSRVRKFTDNSIYHEILKSCVRTSSQYIAIY